MYLPFHPISCTTKVTFLQDFLEILKQLLKNFLQILNKCFLDSDSIDYYNTETLFIIIQASAERKNKLQEASKHAESFNSNRALLDAWLQLNKDKLDSIPEASLEAETLNRELKDAQAIQSELLRKHRDHDALNQEGEALIENSEQHQDVISHQLDDINEKWRNLDEGMIEI